VPFKVLPFTEDTMKMINEKAADLKSLEFKSKDDLYELWNAATYLQIPELKEHCLDFVNRFLSQLDNKEYYIKTCETLASQGIVLDKLDLTNFYVSQNELEAILKSQPYIKALKINSSAESESIKISDLPN